MLIEKQLLIPLVKCFSSVILALKNTGCLQLLTTCTALDYNLPFCPRFEKKYLRKLSAVALSALDQWL